MFIDTNLYITDVKRQKPVFNNSLSLPIYYEFLCVFNYPIFKKTSSVQGLSFCNPFSMAFITFIYIYVYTFWS